MLALPDDLETHHCGPGMGRLLPFAVMNSQPSQLFSVLRL